MIVEYPTPETPEGVQPWDRQEGEGDMEWLAFRVYLLMGACARSTTASARCRIWLSKHDPLLVGDSVTEAKVKEADAGSEAEAGQKGRPPSDMVSGGSPDFRWSRERDWRQRAEAWDRWRYETDRQFALKLTEAQERQAWLWRVKGRLDDLRLNDLIKLRCDEMLKSGLEGDGKPLTSNSIQKLAVASERAGLARERAFQGLRDVMQAGSAYAGDLDAATAAAIEAAMAKVAAEALGSTTAVVTPA